MILSKLLRFYQFINFAINYLFNKFNEKLFLKNFFKENKINNYFDIGANNGSNISIYQLALNIKKIYAFEPGKEAYRFLQKQYSNNKNILIYNQALSNINEHRKFYDYKINSQSSFYKIKDKNSFLSKLNAEYNVETLSLDTFCEKNNISNIDFIKIDAQGEDYNILLGMNLLLKKKKIKLLKIEISINNSSEDDDLFKIIKLMNIYSYKLISVSEIKYNKNQTVLFMDCFFSYF